MWIRVLGPWGSVLLLTILVAFMYFRTDDRYYGRDAFADWQEHAREHELLMTWIDKEFEQRVPPPSVIKDIAEIRANQAAIQASLAELKADVRVIRNGQVKAGG